jgi:hypothetical protein
MLHGFTYLDWMRSIVDQKSTSGYFFSMGSTMTSWYKMKHGSISQSTAEEEYIAASPASREVMWLRKILSYLFSDELEPIVIHCDN